MKIKTTLGWVSDNLIKAIEISRNNMEYGSYIETEGGMMNNVYTVHVADSDSERSCVGTFTAQGEAEKCFEWWKEHGDWVRLY